MAKIIKCPKCGENVEIPPNAAGTVVKCGACGTGLRVKAKPAQAAGEPGQGSMSGSVGGSVSGSMNGTVIGQTGYGQQLSPESDPDGPPSLRSECAMCGKSVDPDDLIEDRGQLVCSRCAKRPAHRAAAGAMTAPSPEPNFNPALRHGPMIRISGAFLAGCAALLIVGAAQAFLYFNPKPEGSRRVVASLTPVKSTTTQPVYPTVTSWEDQNRAEIVKRIEEAQQAADADPKAAIQKLDELLNTIIGDRTIEDEALKNMVEMARADRAKLAETLAAAVATPGESANVPTTAPMPEEVAANTETPGPQVPPAPEEPETMEDAPKPNIFELPPDTPEQLGPVLLALSEKQYEEAARLVEQNKIVPPRQVQSRDFRMTLETLAAVNLANGQYNLAEGQLKRAAESYASAGAKPTRSLVLNRAMAQLGRRIPPPQNVAKDLHAFLSQHGGPADETAHAILGTAISRIEGKVKEKDELVNFLNSYTQQLDGTRAAEGKRRWGVNWADAEKVAAAQKYVEDVNAQITALDLELDKYAKQRQGAAYAGTKENIEKAEANFDRVYGEIHSRKQQLLPYQPKWLEKLEPVMPEVEEESAAPPPPVPDVASEPPPSPVEPARREPVAPLPPPPPIP